PIEQPLFELEGRDAVAQQAPDPIGALEDGHEVAGAVELIRRSEPGRPGPDDGDALAGAPCRRTRHDPAFVERAVDDRDLDRLDRDRIVADPEDARALARRRAEPPGELGEI